MAELDLEIPLETGIAVVGGMFDDGQSVAGFWDDAWKVTKSVVRSPVVKVVVGGLAIAYPPVGVPASVALAAADTTVRASEAPNAKVALQIAAAKGVDYALTQTNDPKVRKALEATRVLTNTKRAAEAGDPDAVRGLKTIEIAQRARATARKAGIPLTHEHSLVDAARMRASGAAAGRAAASHRGAASPGPGWIHVREGFYRRG
jgi:hypothetical protein